MLYGWGPNQKQWTEPSRHVIIRSYTTSLLDDYHLSDFRTLNRKPRLKILPKSLSPKQNRHCQTFTIRGARSMRENSSATCRASRFEVLNKGSERVEAEV